MCEMELKAFLPVAESILKLDTNMQGDLLNFKNDKSSDTAEFCRKKNG